MFSFFVPLTHTVSLGDLCSNQIFPPRVTSPHNFTIKHCEYSYSRTSRKRPLKMSSLGVLFMEKSTSRKNPVLSIEKFPFLVLARNTIITPDY